MSIINLSSVDAACFQKPNPPGLTTALCVISRSIQGSWPKVVLDDEGNIDYSASDFTADGELKNIPTLAAGVKWSEYVFPNGTAMVDCDASGDNGYASYKQSIELAMAGFSKNLRKEVKKHLNAGSVWIVQMKGGEWVVVGSSDDPIFAKTSFKGGKGGKDKRGYTLKGEADAMSHDLLVIPNNLVQNLEIHPVPEPTTL